jgi:hypothetical protein
MRSAEAKRHPALTALKQFYWQHQDHREALFALDSRPAGELEASLERAWAQDPVVLAETKGTPKVHSQKKAVN